MLNKNLIQVNVNIQKFKIYFGYTKYSELKLYALFF